MTTTPSLHGATDAGTPHVPAGLQAGEQEAWLVEFRNSAGQTVAHASYDARHNTTGIADRVTADLEIYFSWLVKDATARRPHDAYTAVVVANPAHTRTLAARSHRSTREPGDG